MFRFTAKNLRTLQNGGKKMRLLLAILTLGVVMTGSALAQPVDWHDWAAFSYGQLYDGTASYASAWTLADAEADNDDPFIVDPWTFTYTSAAISDASKATRGPVDSIAKIGASTQSISAFGDKNSGWGNNGIMFLSVPLNPGFDNVAIAQTGGFIESDAVYQAWSVLPMESYTWADSDESESESWAVGVAQSDNYYY
jgi:hypothetical protein